MRRALPAALALWFCACAPRAVVVEGWAPVDARDPAGTRRRALVQAERAAVERVLGVSLAGRTEVEDGVAVSERLRAAVSGRVESFEVLSEREEGGLHKTTIRAHVARGPAPPLGTTVSVALEGMQSEAAAAGLRESLRQKGFTVVGSSADLAVTGRSELYDLGRVESWPSMRARLSLRVERGSEAVAEVVREAAAIDVLRAGAESKAARSAGELAGESLAERLEANTP